MAPQVDLVFLQTLVERQGQELDALRKGGGGGTTGGMDFWQTSVEKRLDNLSDRMGRVEVGLATLTERVAHLPGKGFVVASAVSTVTALTAILIFADKFRALLGVSSN